jgi:hypothetical protein
MKEHTPDLAMCSSAAPLSPSDRSIYTSVALDKIPPTLLSKDLNECTAPIP